MMNELKDEGFITYQKNRDEKGQWVHEYTVYPERQKDIQKKIPERENPPLDKSDLEFPMLENPHLYKGHKKKEKKHKEKSSKQGLPAASFSEELISFLRQAGIVETDIESLRHKFTSSEVEKAISHMKAKKATPEKPIGWIIQCIKEKWFEEPTPESHLKANKAFVSSYLGENDISIGDKGNIVIGANYVEHVSGQFCKRFDLTLPGIQEQLKVYFQKIGYKKN